MQDMNIRHHPIEGLYEIIAHSHKDNRGCFFEVCNPSHLETFGISYKIAQVNQSVSKKGVLRGLHFQKKPQAQSKLVRVLSGRIFDVAVDLRKHAPTFGQWVGITLEKNDHFFLIPEYCAHGFLTLSDDAVVEYFCSNSYNPLLEESIRYDDKTLNIKWQASINLVSEKDLNAPHFDPNRTYF